jgi:hypothetical protein
MRLWSLHPKYLDPQGLVALWREALLAREVLRGRTRGYRSHPQLERFRACSAPVSALNAYLAIVYFEASARGYAFDRAKLGRTRYRGKIQVTDGQLQYEWAWLLGKLRLRNPARFELVRKIQMPEVHPLFRLCKGDIEGWERVRK